MFEFKQTIEKYISVKQNCYRSNFSMLYNSSLCSTLKWIQLFIRQDYFVNLECVWCALLNTKISSIPTFKFIRLFAGVYKRENQTQKVMLIGWELLWRIDKRERFQSDISSVDHFYIINFFIWKIIKTNAEQRIKLLLLIDLPD